ncbi:MAG: YihY/virulence factor BrkB family protein [Candidatus Promineifilaceae bacterium]|nr:YihY/virulence factor BrkB family protein [Candidatus Promineifilaceae bacterium]
MRIVKDFFSVLIEAGNAWSRDKASLYAAAIAYYMVFSIAPLLVFAIAIAGRIFGQAAVEGQIVAQVDDIVGHDAAMLLQSLLQNAISGSSSFTLISMAVLLWAASGVFNQLKRALDIIYGVIPKQIPGIKGIIYMIRHRFLAFAMVLIMGILLLAAFAVNAIVATLGNYFSQYLAEVAMLNTYIARIFTPVALFLLFIVIFKMLPEARVSWLDVGLGSLVTTLLFLLGVYLIGIYLSVANVGSVYGAAGSLIVILVWIYYSTQIVMYGAEFTKVHANTNGRPIVPRSSATSLAEHYNNIQEEVLEQLDPVPEPEPQEREVFGEELYRDEPQPQNQTRKQIAAGLLGLAAGLFLGFMGQFLQDD